MHLDAAPLLFILIGLAFYAVLAGADFGAGMWQLTAGEGPAADRLRAHADHAMAPVWEANHVWLIFVLTVSWTAYPVAFGSIASTLSIPLFVASIGIILRGGAYVLRSGVPPSGNRRWFDTVFSLSSILTPFALGTVIGGIASGRVPVGNAAGDQLSSWLNPTSALIGALAVATAAYNAAVFLAADAARAGEGELLARFRKRALASGLVAGAAAVAGLAVLRWDAHRLFSHLLTGKGLPALLVSVAAGALTLALVWRGRYEAARYTSALAVAAIVFGWALAQAPQLLPGLTIAQAAAPHDTLVALIVAVAAGGAILFPSLGLLFRLSIGGRLTHGGADAAPNASERPWRSIGSPSNGRLAAACLVAGIGFTTIADSAWAHAIGIVALFGFIAFGFLAALPPEALPAERAVRPPRIE